MKNNQKKRYTIAVLSGDTQSDFSENTLRDLYVCAEKEDVNLIYLKGPSIPQYCKDILEYNSEGDYHHQFKSVFDYVHFTQADSLIVFAGSITSYLNLEDIRKFLDQYAQIPYVLMQNTSNDEDVPHIVVDNYNSMKQCVEHLAIDHGYKKIAFLSGPKVNSDAEERLAAYKDVMQACGNPVSKSMIAYGNYTENVDDLVRILIDQNPGLEAIVCANDNMAKSCYRVCQERNLVIGKDIAITGFDDVEMAKEMTPPLTSVAQNSYAFAYMAIKYAIALCEGKDVSSVKLPLALQVRSSCGCERNHVIGNADFAPEEVEQMILAEAESIAAILLAKIPYKEEYDRYTTLIKEFFDYIYRTIIMSDEKAFDSDYLFGIFKQLIEYTYISNSSLSEQFTNLLEILLNNVDDPVMGRQLAYIMEVSQQEVYSFDKRQTEQEIKTLNRKSWFVPSLTRDLSRSGSRDDLREVFLPIMRRFQTMNIKSCYIYLFQDPVIYQPNRPALFPRSIYLTAYYNQNAMVCYRNSERPRITERKGFTNNIPSDNSVILTSFVLFSEDKQYGMMLCEVEPDDISFMYTCGMQIGSLLRYLEMNWTEQEAAVELQNSLNVIQEQNRVLSFVSDYDELSQLLNRRGFMEQAIALCSQNQGQKAFIIFSDVDHLKEINDCYGHTAGDLAIKSAASLIRTALPAKAITGRIGGDEFVSVILADELQSKEEIIEHLRGTQNSFNDTHDLPYYIEFSIGVYEFVCSPGTEINSLIQKSDEIMYQAKKMRRKTIQK